VAGGCAADGVGDMKTLAILKVISKFAIFAILVPLCLTLDWLGAVIIGAGNFIERFLRRVF